MLKLLKHLLMPLFHKHGGREWIWPAGNRNLAGAEVAQRESQLERRGGLFEESGLKGMSCESGAVYGRLTEVLVSHEEQTADRLRDVKNTRVNRLKI